MASHGALAHVAVSAAALFTLSSGAPALADAPHGPAGNAAGHDAVVIEETFTLTGAPVGVKAFGSDGREVALPAAWQSRGAVRAPRDFVTAYVNSGGDVASLGSGSGGTSTASGCRRINVRNERESTYTGSTVFWFNTFTEWCWNRSTSTITSAVTGYYLEDVHSTAIWQGIIVDNRYYYAWVSGKSKSGYYHEKQGKFDNCVLKYGCVGSFYPRNLLRSYSNGTYSWQTWN